MPCSTPNLKIFGGPLNKKKKNLVILYESKIPNSRGGPGPGFAQLCTASYCPNPFGIFNRHIIMNKVNLMSKTRGACQGTS